MVKSSMKSNQCQMILSRWVFLFLLIKLTSTRRRNLTLVRDSFNFSWWLWHVLFNSFRFSCFGYFGLMVLHSIKILNILYIILMKIVLIKLIMEIKMQFMLQSLQWLLFSCWLVSIYMNKWELWQHGRIMLYSSGNKECL